MVVVRSIFAREEVVKVLYPSFESVAFYGIDMEYSFACVSPISWAGFRRDMGFVDVCPDNRGEVGLKHNCVLFRGDTFSTIVFQVFPDFFNECRPVIFRFVFRVETAGGVSGCFGIMFVEVCTERKPYSPVRFEEIRE